MIVSHRHRFIFFAVPRTGTHAVRAALQPFPGPDDWQQKELLGRVRSPLPTLRRMEHGHITLRQARAHLPEAVWRTYFKFAFVRNSCDRFVSACAIRNTQSCLPTPEARPSGPDSAAASRIRVSIRNRFIDVFTSAEAPAVSC